jgi:hypothetical protein
MAWPWICTSIAVEGYGIPLPFPYTCPHRKTIDVDVKPNKEHMHFQWFSGKKKEKKP